MECRPVRSDDADHNPDCAEKPEVLRGSLKDPKRDPLPMKGAPVPIQPLPLLSPLGLVGEFGTHLFLHRCAWWTPEVLELIDHSE
ncbi:MAG TPA: hypothetical protein DEP35_08390 [Deltaproteobacteria bacterium]|nr:hypothetical protein [Deltaproteobacteria bacterium]